MSKSVMKTPVDKLNKAIQRVLQKYANDVTHDVEAVAVKMGQRGAAALREKSAQTFPVIKTHKITSNYAKGWTFAKEGTRLGATVTIYSKVPGLPHLLEYGHVCRNGTERTYDRVPGYEHIKPIAEELETTFEREVLGKI